MSPRTDSALLVRAREIFQAASELEPGERAGFVAEACGADAPLRGEVDSLLASFDRSGGFLEGSLMDPAGAFWVGRRIGEYEILRLLGRGGVGLVFEARQDRPHRTVALKLLRPELGGEEVRRRFDVEAELLGILEHPGIARIYGAGAVDTELGPQAYLAMELIEGRTLLDHAAAAELPVPEKVRLIQRVCDAVHHAHERGVIHRDLKPGNVLVDDSGQPKVLDFGVAQATNADIEVETIYTQAGSLVGTVSYMSPEQARGASDRLDARTDVYSLGVMLYQLLAGRLPLPVSEMSLPEAIRTLAEEEPPPLSVVVPGVSTDLATVVGKAIEREPARRYASAAALSEDLGRYLADEPVLARPPSALYRLRKFAVRNRAPVAGVAALIVLLTAGVIVTTLGQLREQRLRLQAEASRARAERAQRLSDFDAYASNLASVEAAIFATDVVDASSRLVETGQGLRGWEWTHLRLRLDRSERLIDNGSGIESMGVTPDGRMVVTGGTDCHVRAWDLEAGTLQWTAELAGRAFTARGLAVSPTGELVAAARGSWYAGRGQFGPVTLLDVRDGSVVAELEGHEDVVQAFAFHPTEPVLLSASSDGTVRAWSLTELRELRVVAEHGLDVRDVRWSPDAGLVASAGWDGRLIVVDATTWETRQTFETGERLSCLAWSPDGAWITAGTWDGRVLLLDLADGSAFYTEGRHVGRVEDVGFTPDGRALLSAAGDDTLQRHALPRGTKAGTWLGSTNVVTAFSFERNGTVLSGALDGFVRRWRADTRDVPRLAEHEEWVFGVALSPDGRSVATVGASAKGTRPPSSYVLIHDLSTRTVRRKIVVPVERLLWSADFAPDSRRLATAGADLGAMIWDTKTGAPLFSLEHPDELRCAVFDPLGEALATTCRDRRVRIWNARAGELLLPPLNWDERRPYAAAYSPDGRRLAVGYYGGGVAIWDASSGELRVGRAQAHSGDVYTVAFSPDGRTVVSAGRDRRLRVWDSGELLPLRPGVEAPASVASVSFFPDGERLAVGDRTGLLRIFETERWRQVVSLRGHEGRITSVAVSGDGRFVLSGGSDGVTHVWDGGSPAERLVDELSGELLLAHEVIDRIESVPGLDPDERVRALELAEARRLDEDDLSGLDLSVAVDSGLRQREYAAAARRARVLFGARPDDPGRLVTLGALLYRTGELDEALELLEEACALDGGDAFARAFLTLTFAALGEGGEARAGLRKLERMAAEEERAEDLELLTVLSEVRATLDPDQSRAPSR